VVTARTRSAGPTQRLEALFQRDIPGAAPDIGCRFVVAIFDRTRDEGWIRVHDVVHTESDCGVVQPGAPSTGIEFGSGHRYSFRCVAIIRLYVLAIVFRIVGDGSPSWRR